MNAKDTGGSAFPSANAVTVGDSRTNGHPGMTLRDYFAAKAMQGWFASSSADSALPPDKTFAEHQPELCVLFYGWADAMLAARTPEAQ